MYHLDEEKDLSKGTAADPGVGDDLGDDSGDNEEDLDSWDLEADLEE
jgi:hypothetical protein